MDTPGGAPSQENLPPTLTSKTWRQLREERLKHLWHSERFRVHEHLSMRSCYKGLRLLGGFIQVLAFIVGAMILLSLDAVPDSSSGSMIVAILASAGMTTALLLAVGAALKWMADIGDVKLELLINALDERRRLLGPAPPDLESATDDDVPASEPTVCPWCLYEIAAGDTRCGICGRRRPMKEPPQDEPAPEGE
ncbi:MAG: hypothetical protein JXL80_04485 [Planctomycetes bacterium]|nr:hypothetical protein [Planctomycetota bacterium]